MQQKRDLASRFAFDNQSEILAVRRLHIGMSGVDIVEAYGFCIFARDLVDFHAFSVRTVRWVR